jgi:hypothetical protein
MATHLKLGFKPLEVFNTDSNLNPRNPTAHLHFLPCKINYTGISPVQNYFLVDHDAENESLVSTKFRGRSLLGNEIDLGIETTGKSFASCLLLLCTSVAF